MTYSGYSNTANATTLATPLVAPSNFSIYQNGFDPDPSHPLYDCSWEAVSGAVEYEIWSGEPQTNFVSSVPSTLLHESLGNVLSGRKFSVRAKNANGDYSPFSNFEIVP